MLTDEDDILLWNKFKDGNKEAFNNLFRRYHKLLMQYGSRFCNDEYLLEDCIQDLFIELWQSKNTTPIQSVKAYLLRSLKYEIFNQLKKQHSIKATNVLEDEMDFELSHDHFVARQEDEREKNKKVIDAINKLPNRQKEIVYLKIYQGFSYEEISEIMGINYQVARNLFHQSVKSLRLLFFSN